MARILVIDDEKTLRQLMVDLLEREGHEVEAAANAFRALEVLGERRFDAVLLDVMMPNMDGYELMGTIREDSGTTNVPVIAVTALDDPKNRQRIEDLGFFAHVAKPFDATELLEVVKRALGSSQ